MNQQNRKLIKLKKANAQNVTAGPAFSNNQGKNCPTIQTATHNENVQMATALLLTSVGKISLMMIHVTGPSESAKQAMNRTIMQSNKMLLELPL